MPRAIITYHSVDESNSVLSTRATQLQDLLRAVGEEGAEIVNPSSMLALSDDRPAVALTFDDGYANFFTDAFPALAESGAPATVFLVAGLCGQQGNWGRQPSTFRDPALLSWSQIEELNRAGIRFGAHGMTHRSLISLSADEMRGEILDSKRTIEDRTGIEVECFAYPYGEYTTAAADIVAEHFSVGLTTELAYLGSNRLPELLPRIDAYYLRPQWVRRGLLRPTGRLYLESRSILRGWRTTSRASAR